MKDRPETIIASYLAGKAVAPEDLRKACEALAGDESYLRFLREEFCLDGLPVCACDQFAERAAEFSELSDEERRRQMPELAEHVDECETCRALFWELRELWEAPQAPAGGAESTRRLSEPLRLVLGPSGGLREEGLGPRAIRRAPLAKAAGKRMDLRVQGMDQREWVLADPESGFVVALTVSPAGPDEVKLEFSVRREDQTVERRDVRVEVHDVLGRRPPLSCSLADFKSPEHPELKPITRPRGSWRIVLEVSAAGKKRQWEIPLTVDTTDVPEQTE